MDALPYTVCAFALIAMCIAIAGVHLFCLAARPCFSSKVASHAFVNSVVAVALGAWLLGEPITYATIAGMALVLMSVFCIFRFGSE
jgi:drug/metabolite transporter (DMT)-like permease